MAYTFDSFDTFDEGVVPGGLRSKDEIKILICYIFYSVKEILSKELVVSSINNEGLANYFEISSAFDELVKNESLIQKESENSEYSFELTDKGSLIASQLENALSYTVKEKAYACATKLLSQKAAERDNSVKIIKTDSGYDVEFTISGGSIDLFKFKLYAPVYEQALMMKNNFYENPSAIYKIMLAFLTKDKESVGEALEELYGIS